MAEQTLKQSIQNAVKAAMKAREKERLGALRLITSEIKRIEVDERVEVDDARLLAVLDKMLKQRRESRSQYESAGRADLAGIEAFEMGVIQEFLPAALGIAELEQIVTAAISDSGATSVKDMGAVMALVKPQVQGRADMSSVSQLIRQRLA